MGYQRQKKGTILQLFFLLFLDILGGSQKQKLEVIIIQI